MADHTTYREPGRESEQIRREIERTRAEMDHTVDALAERLSPGHIVDEIWNRLRQNESAGRAVGSAFKAHPIPLSLVSLGLGWLAYESTNQRSGSHDGTNGLSKQHVGPGTHAAADGRKGPFGPDAVNHADPDWAHASMGTRAKAKLGAAGEAVSGVGDKVGHAGHRVGEVAHEKASHLAGHVKDAKETVTERAGELREKGMEAAQHAADMTRERAHQVKEGFGQVLDEKPMMLGALALGLGIAAGLSIPSTGAEDRTIGRASSELKEEARRTAESAKAVAREAAGAAREEIRHLKDDEGGSAREAVNELKSAARRVAESTKEAARHSAEREGLTRKVG